MKILAIRDAAEGLRRYCSPYLLSAFLVLLGSFLLLYESGGVMRKIDLRYVFVTQIVYALSLVLVMAYLYRVMRLIEDTLLLLGILGLLVLDALGVQHLYGWEYGEGKWSAVIGSTSAILLLVGATMALKLPLGNRLLAVGILLVIFMRLGPFLLVDPVLTDGSVPLSPAYFGLGCLLACSLLPLLFFEPLDTLTTDLPAKQLERWGLLVCYFLALGHFFVFGRSLGLPFYTPYVAPFLILLPVAVDHAARDLRETPWLKTSLDLSPYLGLALAATSFQPSMIRTPFSSAFPLTPFWLMLLLTIAVMLWRSRVLQESGKVYAAGVLAALAIMGFDLPEALTRLRYPSLWQVMLVAPLCWTIMVCMRRLKANLALHGVISFVVASLMTEHGYPFVPIFLIVLAWGTIVIERLCGIVLRPEPRIVLVSLMAVLPAIVLAGKFHSPVRLSVAVLSCIALYAIGRHWKDRLLSLSSYVCTALSTLVVFTVYQHQADIPVGRIFIEFGFLVLLFSLLNTIYGTRIKHNVQKWWRKIAQGA
ncbi:hypothetical protein ACFLU6_00770 [Acidobacteriota bacterium]